MKKLVLIIVLAMAICSCMPQKDLICTNSENLSTEYYIKDTISLPVEKYQYNFAASFVTNVNDIIIFGGYDSHRHKIDLYDLLEEKYLSSIELAKEGPNAVNDISSIYFHTVDSIFLAQSGYHTIYLINDKGVRISQWHAYGKILNLQGEDYSGQYGIGAIDKYGMELFMLSNKKILTHFVPVSTNKDNERLTIYDMPSVAMIDLETNEIISFYGRYPEDYQGSEIPRTYFISNCINTVGDISIVYPASNHLYSSKLNEYVCINSNYYRPRLQTKYDENDGGESEELLQSYERDGAFSKIVHDPYRHYYYVVVKHAIKLDMEYYDKYASTWSIIKLDENYNIIGETMFEKNTYDFMNIEVIPEGILVSMENPLNPKNREDYIEFVVIML